MRFAPMPNTMNDILEFEKTPLHERLNFNTPYDVIKNAATQFPEKLAIIFLPDGNAEEVAITITFQDLFQKINQAANVFSQWQEKNGNVVSYLMPNLPETQFTLWGAQAVGIVQPLRPDLSPQQIASLLQASNSKTLVTVGEKIAPPIWKNILAARELYPALKTIFVMGGTADEEHGIYDFNQLCNDQLTRLIHTEKLETSPNAICAYFHTSATTTPNPKLVRLTQHAQVYSAWATGTCLGYRENDCIAVGLPFFHVGAPMVCSLAPFMCGATTVMMSAMGWMNPNVINHFWEIVEKYHVTITAALNFIHSQLLRAPGIEKNNFLRLAISGTPLSATESRHYQQFGIQAVDIYGSSETVIACFNPPDNAHASAMGLRFPYEKMKVMKSDDAECEINEIGELWIAGPNLTQGYIEGSHNAFTQDGWFKSGDLVHQDTEGRFWFFDRTADVIHRKTGFISSLSLEHTFEKHPKVDRAAVIGQPDLQHGEVPVLYVTAKPGSDLHVSELHVFSRENLNPLMAPIDIHIEAAFPLNGIAKVVKPLLREKNIVRLYSEVLEKLFTETDITFDVTTRYNNEGKIIAKISLLDQSGYHDMQDLTEIVNKAFTDYPVPVVIATEESTYSFER